MKKFKNCLICFLLFALMVTSVIAFNQTRTTANADNPVGEASLPEGATFRMTNKVYLRLNGEGGFAFEVEMNEGAKSYIDDENFDRSLYFIIMPAKYLANVGANYAETIRRDGAENSYAYNAEKSFCVYVKSTSTYKKQGSDYIYARCGVGNVKTANRALDFIGIACIEQNNGNGDYSYIYATVPIVNETSTDYVKTNLYAVLNKDVLYSGTDDSAAIKSIPQYDWFGLGDYPVKIESLADYNALAVKLNGGYDYGDAIIEMTDDYAAQEGATPLENENNRLYSVTFKNGDIIFDKYYVSTGAKIYKPEINPEKAEDDANVYNFNSWQVNSVDYDFENGTVAEDITLEAKYTETKKKYTVSFDVDGGVAVPDQEVEYGTPASALSQIVTTKVGYVFDGWTFEDGSAIPEDATVTGNVIVKAKWKAATDTAYVVNHYQQNVYDDDYVLADTDNCNGTTNAEATVTLKDYVGFKTGVVVEQKTVAADGSTVVEVRYDRIVREYSVLAVYSENGEARIREGVAKYDDVTALFAQDINAQDKHVRFGATVDLSTATFDFIPSNYELDAEMGKCKVVVGAENDLSLTLYYRIKAEQTRILALRSDGATAQWMFDGDSYTDNATYYYASGKYRQDGTTEQYVLVKRSSEARVLSLELAEHDSQLYNSLLRIQLSYNDAVYTYDETYNVWKDADGIVNDKILMYNEDGSIANLKSLATNAIGKYVRFEILGITTDLKILNNPPTAGWNNGDTSTYVTLEYKNIAWRQINSDVYGSISYSYVTVVPEQTQIEVAVGSKVGVGVNVYNLTTLLGDPALTWRSENDNIATVADGVITGVSTGETNIVVTYVKDTVEYRASIKVSVTNKVVTANVNYDVYKSERDTYMPVNGIDADIDVNVITKVVVGDNEALFEVREGVLYVAKADGGYYDLIITADKEYRYTLLVKNTSGEGVLTDVSLEWSDGGVSYAPDGTYYYSSGRYRSDNGKEQYAEITYVDGMNVLSFELAGNDPVGIGYTDNHLLRFFFRYNGKTFLYDRALNVWKDGDGLVNDKIFMYLSDGSIANLATVEMSEYVRFVIVGINTTLQIVNYPPNTQHNNQDNTTYVNISHRNKVWYSLDESYVSDASFETYTVILGEDVEISNGTSLELAAEVYKTGVKLDAPEILYTFGDGTIAKYENGKVYGLKTGVTTLTATYVVNGIAYSATINVSVTNLIVTANYYYDVVDNTVGTDMPIYGLPETITLSEITGVTVDGTSVEFSVKNGALHIPKVSGGYHEIVLTDNGGNANTFTLKVTQSSADGEWKAGTLQWGYGASDTYYGVAGGALSNGKYRSDGVTEQYSYYAYAEGMNAVTFKIADYNRGDYNSLMRIQLGFNGKVYTYDGETNTWKDADGNVNANIRMFRADGSNVTNLADIAKSVNGDIGELVTFVITDITTDLKIINNPPTTNHNPGDANTYVTLTNNGCTWYNL